MLGSIVIIVAGFSVNKYVFSSKVYDGVTTVTDIVAIYPVNIFDFKQTMQNYAYKEDVLNYSKQYTQCTLPYKYIIG